jgi:osmotically-inducible protein OsmY
MPAVSDIQIANSAERSLSGDPLLPKGRVAVFVRAGWITLTGEVPRDIHRWTAEADVRHLPGVAGVENRIVVRA